MSPLCNPNDERSSFDNLAPAAVESEGERVTLPDSPDASDVVEAFCKLREEVASHFGHQHPTDCMCGKGGLGNMTWRDGFRDDGVVLEFIRDAVRARLALASDSENEPSTPAGPTEETSK